MLSITKSFNHGSTQLIAMALSGRPTDHTDHRNSWQASSQSWNPPYGQTAPNDTQGNLRRQDGLGQRQYVQLPHPHVSRLAFVMFSLYVSRAARKQTVKLAEKAMLTQSTAMPLRCHDVAISEGF
jgi:hypothetical protein